MATAVQEDELAAKRAKQEADDELTIAAANAAGDTQGSSIDDLTDSDEPTPPMQIPIPGTQDTVSLTVGGSKPTVTEVRLLGGSLPVEGEFRKGDEVTLMITAKVGSVEFVDSTDEWGTVTKTIRRHKLRMTSVKRPAG